MTKTITALDVLAELNMAVKNAGPATKRQCRYVSYAANPVHDYDFPFEEGIDPNNTGVPVEPHCIVGVVLNHLGVSLEQLTQFEETSVSGIRASAFDRVTDHEFKVEDEAWTILDAAQQIQDSGRVWGEALDEAKHTARMLNVLND